MNYFQLYFNFGSVTYIPLSQNYLCFFLNVEIKFEAEYILV